MQPITNTVASVCFQFDTFKFVGEIHNLEPITNVGVGKQILNATPIQPNRARKNNQRAWNGFRFVLRLMPAIGSCSEQKKACKSDAQFYCCIWRMMWPRP